MNLNEDKKMKATDSNKSFEGIVQKRNGFHFDSFNRFCDDLVEVIVDYLPLKQKLVLSCVNKQFNRCLFNKQIDFVIDSNNRNANQFNSIEGLIEKDPKRKNVANVEKDEKCEDIEEEEENDFKKINKIGFECVVNKCKLIRKIDLRHCLVDGQVIELICNNCKHLEEIKLLDKGFEEKDIIELGKNCGKNLETLVIVSPSDKECSFAKSLLNYCPNLRAFYGNTNDSIDSDKEFLPKLEKFDITLNDNNFNLFDIVCDKYSKQLNVISITLNLKSGNNLSKVLEKISSFTQLKGLYLTIERDPEENLKPIDSFLTQIAINCTQVETLDVNISQCTHKLISGNIFAVFGLFHNMKTFEAQLPARDFDETNYHFISYLNDWTKSATVKCFKDCPKLTQFTLNYTELTYPFVKNIHKYLPKLKVVDFVTSCDLYDEGLMSLSRLKDLRVFALSKNFMEKDVFYGITDMGICILVNDCKNIEFIVFNGRPDITSDTIKYLIKTAEERPEKKIQFVCDYGEFVEVGAYTPIQMNKFPNLPNNLKITLRGPGDNLSDDEFDVEEDDSEDDGHEQLDDEEMDNEELDQHDYSLDEDIEVDEEDEQMDEESVESESDSDQSNNSSSDENDTVYTDQLLKEIIAKSLYRRIFGID